MPEHHPSEPLAPQSSGTRNHADVIRNGDPARPMLVLIGGWNAVFVYRPLIDLLASDLGVEVVSLAPSTADPYSPVLDDIAGAAEFVLHSSAATEVIRNRRPLVLVGYSRAGLITYEVACRLHSAHSSIGLQIMIDTIYPGEEIRRRELIAVNRRVKYRRLIESREFWTIIKEITASAIARGRRTALRAGTALMRLAEPEHAEIRLPGEVRALTEDDYRPPPADFPVLLYRASTSAAERTTQRWQDVATDLTEVVIEGRHGGEASILGPDRVDGIATDLGRRLSALNRPSAN